MAEKASFIKLNNDNYIHQSFRMKMVLIERDLWLLVDPDADEPVGDDAILQAAIAGQLQKALALISLNIEEDQLIHKMHKMVELLG